MIVTNVLRLSSKRVPLIKFRKGLADTTAAMNTANVASSLSVASSAAEQLPSTPSTGTVLESWHVPRRYQRRLIDDKEVDYINRGGPE